MKKILMVALMCMMVSSSCLANGVSGIFSLNESMSDKMLEALVGKGNYKSVNSLMTDGMRSDLSAAKLTEVSNSLASTFGKADRYDLVSFIRSNDIATGKNNFDLMDYLVHTVNNKLYIVRVVIVNENGLRKLNGININEVNPVKQGN